jgi:hypothetical protein
VEAVVIGEIHVRAVVGLIGIIFSLSWVLVLYILTGLNRLGEWVVGDLIGELGGCEFVGG